MAAIIRIVLFIILLQCNAYASIYYVATNGSNSNDGLSEAAPFLTIDKCSRLLVAGDTCYVRGGTYTESGGVRIKASGTATLPIKLAAYPGENPVISFPSQTSDNRILVLNAAGSNVAMGYITIEGLEVYGGWEGIKFHNMHNSVIRNMEIHGGRASGIFGGGGHHNIIEHNVIYHQGPFSECAAGTVNCNQDHGMYMHGDSYIIQHNVIYDNIGCGIQQNGSSTSVFTTARHPSAAFSGAANWIVTDNTFAYQSYCAGYLVWGTLATNTRVENNIFYENRVNGTSSQAIFFTGNSMSGVSIKNNHSYASGSGGTAFIGALSTSPVTEGVQYTQSGNVVNVSPPAFVNGGSNSLPASPDFRLTASSPVNIALANEFPNTATGVVGAFKTNPNPTCSITTNKMTCTVASVTPLQNISSAGVTIGCTGSACPGSPTASTTQKIAGTDAQLETVIAGIAGNACVATNQTWTKTYNAATGTWTGSDNIGPYPGLHQKLFSFTSLAVTNACTGSGPPTTPVTPYIEYLFLEGTGTTATNTGSFGASGNGTLSSGVAWVSGGGVSITGSTAQSVALPYGSGQDMSAQDHTISFLVNIPSGGESLSRTVFGAPLDAAPIEERFYISTLSGTWRLGIQATNDGTASDLTVEAGPQHICVRADATANTVTLYKNGIASVSAGGVKAITSYAIPGNFQLGLLPGLTNGHTATYSHFELYRSLEDCNALYQAAIAPPASSGDTFSQTAIQFEEVYTSGVSGTVRVLPSPSNTKKVIKGGAVALVAQVECNNCAATSFRLASRDNGMGDWLQVPNTETSGNTYMWGASAPQFLNAGSLGTRVLENGCTVVTGSTQTTDAQIPSITLPSSGCTMLRYIIKVRSGASGYTEFRVEKEGGVAFAGSYALGRIEVTDMQAGGMGF